MRRLIGLLLLLGISRVHAEPLRITSWNLNFDPQAAWPTGEKRLDQIASVLGSLESDVVLLQEVPDRLTCERLAALLKPSRFSVAICSSFTDRSGYDLPQVAILTRKPVTAAWTEPWQAEGWTSPPGGLAVAAIRHGTGLVVVYSVQLNNNVARDHLEQDTQINILKRELSAAQLVQRAGSVEGKLKHPAASVIIAGSLNTNPDQPQFVSENTLRLLVEAGFKDAFDRAPSKNRITRPGNGKYPDATLDYLFAKGANFLGHPNIIRSELSGHFPVTCDLVAQGALPDAKTLGQLMLHWQWLTLVFAALLLFDWCWFMSRKRFHAGARATSSGLEGLLPIPDAAKDPFALLDFADENGPVGARLPLHSRATDPVHSPIQALERRAIAAERQAARAIEVVRKGLLPHLARLMKDKLFRGLVSERARLLQAQQAGAAQAAELEQRLLKIQSQLQSRLIAYERRIAELEQELSAKEEANRELLAAQLRMIRQALEAARGQQESATR